MSSFTQFEDGGQDPRQHLAGLQRQGAGRHQRLRQCRPDSVSRQAVDVRPGGRQHRGQAHEAVDDLLLRRVGLTVRLLVGRFGFQEADRVGQKLIAGRGRTGSVVAVEALDVARRELGVGDGGGQGIGVRRVGARHRHQALHGAVRRDLAGHDQSLNRRRQHADQVQPARDPALGSPQPERDDIEAGAFSIHQFLDEQRLFERRQRCAGLADADPEERLASSHHKNLCADEIPPESLQGRYAPVPVDDHVLARRVTRDHRDRKLLVVLLQRRQENALGSPITNS